MVNPTTIVPTNNGPLKIQGDFKIAMPSGRELAATGTTWLCRCGASQDKPFCDGSHARIGFHAPEADVADEHFLAKAAAEAAAVR